MCYGECGVRGWKRGRRGKNNVEGNQRGGHIRRRRGKDCFVRGKPPSV